ncbi:14311_t:CDS:2 [Entrophospora sp. SA101]|nr:14311_t:CDS:2 [Entrophospora sp. SA101]CAJ0826530.1 12363_t:CDS:2 [Entrophospora sp. SA101]CAJ0919286.1 22396_t:CDS:2 [Entrophospora sp. SA101]
MAQEWWSYNGPIKLLHSMNPLRVSYIQKQLTKHHSISTNYNISHDNNNDYLPFKGLRILDVGCGGGLLSESLVRLGASVLGVDASSENIKIAKLHSLKDPKLFSGPGNLEYQCITAEELVNNGELFDIVCAMEIIEHVNNPIQFIDSLPNETHDFNKYIRHDELTNMIENVSHNNNNDNDVYPNSHNHNNMWGKVVDVTGIGLNPITGKWFELVKSLPLNLHVNYFITAKRI